MLGIIKEKLRLGNNKMVIGAAVEGDTIPITEVSDPTFGQEILGKGIAILPSVGKVVAPVDGTVAILFDTKHAVSLISNDGIEILVHIGIDTVALKGEHFTTYVKSDDKVKKGDLLIEFDIEKIKAAGYQVVTPIVICNTADYKKVETISNSHVKTLDDIIYLVK